MIQWLAVNPVTSSIVGADWSLNLVNEWANTR